MHVDGFRFDLAATLARELHEVDRLSAFFDLIQQDPVVSQREADRRALGRRRGRLSGRQLPAAVVGVERQVSRHGARLLARRAIRRWTSSPTASPAAPTSTSRRAAGRSRASTSSPRTTASRCATSSPTTRSTTRRTARTTATARATTARGTAAPKGRPTIPTILALRARQQRNFLATLLLSQGVPMLLGGDEIGRTQRGNNNAYCQDNEISWFDWSDVDDGLLEFTRALIRFRREHPGLPPPPLVPGPAASRHGLSDIGWFKPDGERDDRRGLGDRLRQVDRRVPERRRDPDPRRRAASASSTTASTCSSTRTTSRSSSRCPGRRGAARSRSCSTLTISQAPAIAAAAIARAVR